MQASSISCKQMHGHVRSILTYSDSPSPQHYRKTTNSYCNPASSFLTMAWPIAIAGFPSNQSQRKTGLGVGIVGFVI